MCHAGWPFDAIGVLKACSVVGGVWGVCFMCNVLGVDWLNFAVLIPAAWLRLFWANRGEHAGPDKLLRREFYCRPARAPPSRGLFAALRAAFA